ncbi:MAG: phage tail sheath subtilisin-like domain-containing protein [Moorellaceae bacterium]
MSSVYFAGQQIIKPGVYSRVDPTSLTPIEYGATGRIALIGTSVGGPPVSATLNSPSNTPGPVFWLNDPLQAKQILKGGDLLDAARFAWNPSPDGNGADLIAFVRVNPATQASLTLKDTQGNPCLILTSKDWGAWTNNIQVSIQNGTNSGKVVSLQCYQYNIQEGGPGTSADNLGNAFTLQYKGNATSAVLNITNSLPAPAAPTLAASTTGGNLATGTIYVKVTALNASGESAASPEANVAVTGPTGSVTVSWQAVPGATKYNVYASNTSGTEIFVAQVTGTSYTITSLPTSGAAAPTTNTTSKNLTITLTGQTDGSQSIDICLDPAKDNRYSTLQALVNYLAGQSGYTASLMGNGSMPSTYLDPVTSQNITTAYTVTAQLGSIIYWINTYSQLVTAKQANSNNYNPPANIDYTNLAGGSDGNPTNTDWQNAISALRKQDVQFVVPLTNDASIHAMFDAENKYLAQNGIAYRRGFYGGALGETDTQVQTRAQNLNSDRAVLAPVGFYQYDSQGNYKLFPPYMLAAIFAGIAAGLDSVTTPLTNKNLNVLGLERLLPQSTILTFLQNGVAAVDARKKGGYYIVQGITTSISQTNEYYQEFSVGRAVDYVRQMLDEALAIYPGQPSDGATTVASMIATATAVLQAAKDNGIIAGFDKVTGVVQSTSTPTAFLVPVNIYVRDPINYVLVTINLASGAVLGVTKAA